MIEIMTTTYYIKTETTVYSVFDMFGDIGGLIDALIILFNFTIGWYVNASYLGSFVKNVFKIDSLHFESHSRWEPYVT